MMWELIKDLLLVSLGMGIGVVLMCIMSVGSMIGDNQVDYRFFLSVCRNLFLCRSVRKYVCDAKSALSDYSSI